MDIQCTVTVDAGGKESSTQCSENSRGVVVVINWPDIVGEDGSDDNIGIWFVNSDHILIGRGQEDIIAES